MKKVLIAFILLLFIGACTEQTQPQTHDLPFIGEAQIDEDGNSVPHTIASFRFMNQDSVLITEDYLKGKLTVVDFFFTTCPTICPIMTVNMKAVQDHWKNNSQIQFLSHTVDPETDTPNKLKRYGKFKKANFANWHFVTGQKEELYEQGVKSYLLPAQEDALAPGGFLHSEYFVLVDENLHLRGFYDGTKKDQLDSLNNDIQKLLND